MEGAAICKTINIELLGDVVEDVAEHSAGVRAAFSRAIIFQLALSVRTESRFTDGDDVLTVVGANGVEREAIDMANELFDDRDTDDVLADVVECSVASFFEGRVVRGCGANWSKGGVRGGRSGVGDKGGSGGGEG